MKQVAVIGHFAFGCAGLDGQTVKTRTVGRTLIQQKGEEAVLLVDTHGGFGHKVGLFWQMWRAVRQCRHVVLICAHNGLRVMAPWLRFCNRHDHRGLHYVVIGGWLSSFLENKKGLFRALAAFDGIYAETAVACAALTQQGLPHVTLVPNSKEVTITMADNPDRGTPPYALCTFSRVMPEKIQAAIEAVQAVNQKNGKTVFTLDIYGPVAKADAAWFRAQEKAFPAAIRYRGCVPPEESGQTLCSYTALLFPTRFFTEGVPGTVIDAYAAGVPVIASRWESFADVVEEGVTGWGYLFGDEAGLAELLEQALLRPEQLAAMRAACREKARSFLPEQALCGLLAALE